jgi:hypothetical protein
VRIEHAPTSPWRRTPCAPRARSPRGKTSGTSSSWLHSQSKEPPQIPGRFTALAPRGIERYRNTLQLSQRLHLAFDLKPASRWLRTASTKAMSTSAM